MSFGTLLKASRSANGLTQVKLSQVAKTPTSALSYIENDVRSPTFETAQKLLRAARHRLVVAPTIRDTAAECGAAIEAALRGNDERLAFANLVQLADDLKSEVGVNKYALVLLEPKLIGLKVWDAALAAIVAQRFDEAQLPPPSWVNQSARKVGKLRPLLSLPSSLQPQKNEIHKEFLDRGVGLSAKSLESV